MDLGEFEIVTGREEILLDYCTPEEDESAAGESHAEDPSEVAASPEIPTADEIRIRRKRVRH